MACYIPTTHVRSADWDSDSKVPEETSKITQAALNAIMCKEFMTICEDYETRKAKTASDRTILNKGPWYALDYFHLIPHEHARFLLLKKHNAFYRGHPPQGMEHLNKFSSGCFVLKEETLPTTVLDNFLNSFSFIDCTMTLEMAYYRTLRKIWGDEIFNLYFKRNGARPFVLSYTFSETSLSYLAHELGRKTSLDSDLIQEGVVCGYANHEDYQKKHPFGNVSGYNLICTNGAPSAKTFTGFGLKGDGVPIQIIQKICKEAFNASAAYTEEFTTREVWNPAIDSLKLQDQTITESELPQTFEIIHQLCLDRIVSVLPSSVPNTLTSSISTQEELNALIADEFASFCKNYKMRVTNHKLFTKSYDQGAWCPHDYTFLLLQSHEERIYSAFQENGILLYGLPPKGMVLVPRRRYAYILKEESIPSTVLKNALTPTSPLYFIDCSIALQLIHYKVILSLWGEDLFNRYFQKGGAHPFAFYLKLAETPLMEFLTPCLKKIEGPIGSRTNLSKGHHYGFRNDARYSEKHPVGSGGSFNLLCIENTPGNQRFIGFGLPSKGLTEEELLAFCEAEFNKAQSETERILPETFISQDQKNPSYIAQKTTTTSKAEILAHRGGLALDIPPFELSLEKLRAIMR